MSPDPDSKPKGTNFIKYVLYSRINSITFNFQKL
jgi:hypothetical protein